jgi:hypothetical protein
MAEERVERRLSAILAAAEFADPHGSVMQE